MKSKIILVLSFLAVFFAVGCNDDGDGVNGTPISIESINPEVGGPGADLIINGTGFPLDKSKIAVSVNDVTFEVKDCNEEQILAIVPENEAIGKGFVVVKIGEVGCQSPKEFTYFDSRMRIEAVSPLQGIAGAEVTVTGRNFPEDGEVSVSINGIDLEVVDADATTIVVKIPDNPDVNGKIVVKAGDKTAKSVDEFTFTEQIMSITGFAPKSVGPGAEVTITGENFPEGITPVVTVNDIEFAIKSATTTEIVVTVPDNDAVGTGKLKVVAGRKTDYSEEDFVYITPQVRILSFTPASAGSGMEVTITGENFTSDKEQLSVSVNGVEFPVKSATETEIVVTVPIDDNIGTGKIKVVAKGRTGESETDFTHIVSNMSVTSFSPASAPFGTEVTITGENFPTNQELHVSVNGIDFEVKSVTETQVVVAVPKNKAISSGKIRLTDLYGSCESSEDFSYLLTRTVSIVAGTEGVSGYKDGNAAEAQFNFFTAGEYYGGLVVDKDLNIYVADVANNRVRKIAPDGTVGTYAGNDTPDWGANWMNNINATPLDVYITPADILYDKTNHRLFVGAHGSGATAMIDIAAYKPHYAGWGTAASLAFDEKGEVLYSSRLNGEFLAKTDGQYFPGTDAGSVILNKAGISGLAVDGEGNLYVSVAVENKIYKYVKGQWSTPILFAGTGMAGCKDGPALEAQFSSPGRLCFDNEGNLLVAGNATIDASSDNVDQSIRYIDLKTNKVTTFAGAGTTGTVGVDGVSFTVGSYAGADNATGNFPALFAAPSAVAVDKIGAVYVFDRGSHTIKKIITE